MPPKSLQPELHRPGGHPGGGQEAARGEVAAEDPARAAPAEQKPEAAPLAGGFKRWALWFLAFFGIYASSSLCPFCGAPGCPVGIGGAALVGGVFACLWQYGKGAWEKLRGFVAKGYR